jgi:hypothetical protein
MREAAALGRSDAPDHLSHLGANLSAENETEFVSLMASSLELSPRLPTLLGLELALEDRLNRVNDAPLSSLWTIDMLPSSIRLAISSFNGLSGNDDRRWGLLFDELEIAPESVKTFLFASIRSFDDRAVIKLAMAPYMEEYEFGASPVSAHALHDYSTVVLSYANKEDAREFTNELVRNTFRRFNLETNNVPALFANPTEVRGLGRRTAGIAKGRRSLPAEFGQLAGKDQTFARYLSERSVLSAEANPTEEQWAQEVRKIVPIVTLRNFYIKSFTDRASVDRSRKATPYTGFPAILDATEGNPRAILTMIGPMVPGFIESNQHSASLRPISTAEQTAGIRRVEFLLTSLLRVIPLDFNRDSRLGLLEFVDRLGSALSDRLLKQPFSPDYVSSFVLDANVTAGVVKAVGRGLNAGAFIHVPWPEATPDTLLRGLGGQRFRLSYALAARHKLLLTLGGHVRLSNLFSSTPGKPIAPFQAGLFDQDPEAPQ